MKTTLRKALALLLCLGLCFSMLPVSVFAEEIEEEETAVEEPEEIEEAEEPKALGEGGIVIADRFPDPVFRGYVSANFDDGDGLLSDAELYAVRSIYVSGMGIESLAGIELFPNLTSLYCDNNALTELDLSGLPFLSWLWCSDNSLNELKLDGCTALEQLNCANNALTELNLGDCTGLTGLYCYGNRLTALNLGGFAELTSLSCDNESMTWLNLSGCSALDRFSFHGGNLVKLNLSGCSSLTTLECGGNRLTKLELSGCFALRHLNCFNNRLTELDLSDCPLLTSLNCCNNQLTALDLDVCSVLNYLNCNNNSLAALDLSGCDALTVLDCLGNRLAKLELGNCGALTYINCAQNELAALNLGNCPALTELSCYGNSLTELELRGCEALTYLNCAENSLRTLILNNCSALTTLYCYRNELTELDLRGCKALTALSCTGNKLTALDLSGCAALTDLYCDSNRLNTLILRGCTALTRLSYYGRELALLDASGCTALTELSCVGGSLSSLNLSGCGALTELNCWSNELCELALDGCSSLRLLNCSGNKLSALDLGGCGALTALYCYSNRLTGLDLSACSALTDLNCSGNKLTALDLSACAALESLRCENNRLTELDLSACPILAELILNGKRETSDPAFGGDWMRFYIERDLLQPYLWLDRELAENGLIPALSAPESFTLDHDYLLLKPGETAQLAALGLDAVRTGRLLWAASADGDVPETEGSALPIRVSGEGLVTAQHKGTAYAVAYLLDGSGKLELFASCRVDVAESPISDRISSVRLIDTKTAVELYKTDYARVQIVPELLQNLRADGADSEAPADSGAAVESARFADAATASFFSLRVVDDRTLEIVPTAAALNDAKAVKGSYKSAILVTVDGTDFPTAELALTVKKTLPRLTAKAVKLNSFLLPKDEQAISFSGAVAAARAESLPDWLEFDADRRSVRYAGELDAKASGKLTLLAQPEGWSVELPVTVAVNAAPSAPKLSVKPSTLTLYPGMNDWAEAKAALTPADVSGAELTVLSISEGRDAVYPNGSVLNVMLYSDLTIYVQEGSTPQRDGKAHSYKVTLALLRDGEPTSVQTTLTVKLLAADSKITMSAKVTGVLDPAIEGSTATVSATLKGIGTGWVFFYPEDITILREKSGTPARDVTGCFLCRNDGAPLRFTVVPCAASNLEKGYTYTAVIRKTFGTQTVECRVKLPVQFSDPAKVKPSVTIKASGFIDVIRPDSAVTIAPTVKNCFTYAPKPADLQIWKGTQEVTGLFDVGVENGAFVVRLKAGSGVDHTTDKFAVSLRATLDGTEVETGKTNITVKMGAAKLTQSAKTVTLLRDDRYSRGTVTISAAEAGLSEIDWEKSLKEFVSPVDKAKQPLFALAYLGGGTCAIGYAGNALKDVKSATVKIPVFLVGNNSDKPNATVSVSVKVG